MPWLLYRYLLGELLRAIGLTAAVLVTVIAFGGMIKPLSGNMLDAGQAFKYLGLSIVPMLQFALPFAAGFGATLTLHRMTSDNEIQAMSASGISYRRILLPIAGLGLALMLLMLVLTQWVVPRFWAVIQQLVTADITKVFAATIRRGEPFQFNDLLIYADDIVIDENGQEGGPQTRLVLLNFAAAELDRSGRIVTEVTGNQAVIDVYRHGDRILLKLAMSDTVAFNPNTGHLARSEFISPSRALVIPGARRDNPKTLTHGELLALRRNPDDFAQVIQGKQNLAQAIHAAETRAAIDQRLHEAGRVELVSSGPAGDGSRSRTYLITAKWIRGDEFSNGEGQPIEVVQHEQSKPVRRMIAERVQAIVSSHSLEPATFDLTLKNCHITDLATGLVNQRSEISIPDVMLSGHEVHDSSQWSSPELIEYGERLRSGPDQVKGHIAELRREIQELNRQIIGHFMERYALSVTALLLPMLGAVLSIWRRGSLPLITYAWAFAPAIGSLILIAAGEQLLRDGQALGYLVLWSGNAAILFMIVIAYFKLSRN
ncbi:MAG: LptF/LptG family permease [Phycisphaerales bacterium]|nr:LptF/LptG family permease [Phycisphaerales bacterium]MCI0631390.1 LptF/LptG family permease [Phycisphaerales bacterium]MCI0676630.1 LptF/LptG family permease [Phycisphaerales bacterium]